jgi:hypothetical protein
MPLHRCVIFLAASGLAACGATQVKPALSLPPALVTPLNLDVGVFYSPEYRRFEHRETRWGADWKIALGEEHMRMTDNLFSQAFTKTTPIKKFPSESDPAPVQAIIEPRIEQYSFITPRDTQGNFYAVTIKYRLNLDSPAGALIDSFQFTGYGTADGSGMAAGGPMVAATTAAMRDAAAKFLVQFPEQASVKKLARGESILAAESGQGTSEAEEVPMLD